MALSRFRNEVAVWTTSTAIGTKKAGLQRTSLYYLPNIGDRSLLQPGIPFARRLGTMR